MTNSIRALRVARGEMTQAQLAEHIGVTRQTIIAIEQGRYAPSLEMAFQIAAVFGVPVEQVSSTRRLMRGCVEPPSVHVDALQFDGVVAIAKAVPRSYFGLGVPGCIGSACAQGVTANRRRPPLE